MSNIIDFNARKISNLSTPFGKAASPYPFSKRMEELYYDYHQDDLINLSKIMDGSDYSCFIQELMHKENTAKTLDQNQRNNIMAFYRNDIETDRFELDKRNITAERRQVFKTFEFFCKALVGKYDPQFKDALNNSTPKHISFIPMATYQRPF